jgi:uracil-DNA glycosylase family 4
MEPLAALRSYVQFLREREGVRDVFLSLTARRGLALIGNPVPPNSGVAKRGEGSPKRVIAGSEPIAPARTVSTPVALIPNESPLEVQGSSKAEQLRHLGERASVCVKCPHLAARRHTVVFGVGDPEAKVMFVGEAPGEEEDLQGEPFVGRAGQLLTKMITAMGLTREQVYIANILKCRPDMPPGSTGNRKPTRQEMDTCLPYLRAQIDVIQPTVMIALGATAIEGLLGPVGSIGKLRGTFLEYRSIPLMPTFHPSYLLRNQSNTEKRKVWEDLLQVMERVEMPITDKQRGYFLSK